MPTYEFVCTKCGHHFEKFQSMKDPPLKQCPKCGKAGLKRLIGKGSGLIFKGSGFYSTDYRKGPPPPKEGGEAKTSAGESGAAPAVEKNKPAAADAKPAPKKEP